MIKMLKTPKDSSISLEIFEAQDFIHLNLPFVEDGIQAGLPTPSFQQVNRSMDLNQQIIKNPGKTFYARVNGQSMIDDGIQDGDLLVIDKSLEPEDGKIAVCFLDGEFTVKRIKIDKEGLWLVPANKEFKSILVSKDNNFSIWGVVTHVIKSIK